MLVSQAVKTQKEEGNSVNPSTFPQRLFLFHTFIHLLGCAHCMKWTYQKNGEITNLLIGHFEPVECT